jgi:drug/metabolite transporter (DMT)-like permease
MAPRDFALLMLVCLCWGANTIVSKVMVSTLHTPPLAYAGLRFAIVLVLVSPWLRPAPRPIWLALITGFLMGSGTFGFMFIALKTSSPSSAAIVSQLSVPMTVALSVAFLGERLTARRLAGMLLALIGALAVMWDPRGFALSAGLLWVVASCFAAALAAVLMKSIEPGVKPLQLQAWVAMGSLPPMALGSVLWERGLWEAVPAAGWGLVAGLLYSSLVASVFAHTMFYGLLRRYEANLISPLTLAAPIMTIVLGLIITNDHFDLRMGFGALAAIAGVLLIALQPAALTAALARIRSRP